MMRVTGGFSDIDETRYDPSKLIVCPEIGINLNNIRLDITNMPHEEYMWEQEGRWWIPTDEWKG
jgi:hypothetical protein